MAPEIGQLNVLASVVRPISGGNNAGVTKGLRVLIHAKPEKVGAVRDFLKVSYIRRLVDSDYFD